MNNINHTNNPNKDQEDQNQINSFDSTKIDFADIQQQDLDQFLLEAKQNLLQHDQNYSEELSFLFTETFFLIHQHKLFMEYHYNLKQPLQIINPKTDQMCDLQTYYAIQTLKDLFKQRIYQTYQRDIALIDQLEILFNQQAKEQEQQ